jgi:hypothetical protein
MTRSGIATVSGWLFSCQRPVVEHPCYTHLPDSCNPPLLNPSAIQANRDPVVTGSSGQ